MGSNEYSSRKHDCPAAELVSVQSMVERRERLFGPGNPLFYEEPLHLVRGDGTWLFDADNNRYLDCYNNVPCIGHAHPQYIEAVVEQTKLLNTHTRYLHDTILDYAEQLLDKFDASFERVALSCTGSEANDLALRMARCHTGAEGFICTDATYHGNTTAVSQFSSIYEPIGGVSPNVRRVPHPDSYRPPEGLAADELADHYLSQVERAIQSLADSGIGLAGMMICPIFANEGLPDIPAGYLKKVMALVREAGGVLIADEVQAGFGRTGNWWGYQGSDMVPDIVTLGKPMASGYPVAGLVTSGEILDKYRSQEMYFNTFGGNPVACAAAQAVLTILESEDLIGNAARMGAVVKEGLVELQNKYEQIGDVRGCGLFFGLDVVTDRDSRTPDVGAARRLVNDLRQRGVLISKAGQYDNVLKIRPPLCFSESDASMLLEVLDAALADASA